MRVGFVALNSGSLVLSVGYVAAQHDMHEGHMNRAAPAADTREFVHFPPELVEHTIANMRDHLLALQQINEALAAGEPEKAGQIAEDRLGMSSLRLHGAAGIAQYMPQAQDAGTAMHKAASRFAIEAQNVGVTGELKPATSEQQDQSHDERQDQPARDYSSNPVFIAQYQLYSSSTTARILPPACSQASDNGFERPPILTDGRKPPSPDCPFGRALEFS